MGRPTELNLDRKYWGDLLIKRPIDLKLHFGTFVFFVLRFYGPVNLMGSCRARSVYLTTGLLGRHSPLNVNQYCAHSFARN